MKVVYAYNCITIRICLSIKLVEITDCTIHILCQFIKCISIYCDTPNMMVPHQCDQNIK